MGVSISLIPAALRSPPESFKAKEKLMARSSASARKTAGASKSVKKKSASAGSGARSARRPIAKWRLRLYVAGNTPNSIAAFANLKEICEKHMGGKYEIEVIDLLRNPQLAAGDQIVAVPTLVRRLPYPVKKIIG